MKINWNIIGGLLYADVPHHKAVVRIKYGLNDNTYSIEIINGAGITLVSKECNNLTESLHWAEDELKFHAGMRVSNAYDRV